MSVIELIELLEQCNPSAQVEIRGSIGGDYVVMNDFGIDDHDELVVVDI